jgi:NAD(P)-dependent dehydrogenase (short-subunit alcohol dehydrogenase family)
MDTPQSGAVKGAKIALVTGASGNMGQAVVKKFIAEGFTVIGTAAPDDPIPMDFPATVFEKMVVDLANEEATAKLVKKVLDKYGRIDAAVLTVGGFAMGSIADTKTSDVIKQCQLNFETAYNMARPCFMQMQQQGSGRIFLVGSRPGMDAKSSKGMIAYGLSKSLIFRLAELMNEEAKGTNVVTSVIVPSTIDTPQNRKSMPAADFSSWVKPAAIAEAIHFYCTAAAAALREPVIKVYNNA